MDKMEVDTTPLLPVSLQSTTIDEITFANNIATDSDAMTALAPDMTRVFSIDDYEQLFTAEMAAVASPTGAKAKAKAMRGLLCSPMQRHHFPNTQIALHPMRWTRVQDRASLPSASQF